MTDKYKLKIIEEFEVVDAHAHICEGAPCMDTRRNLQIEASPEKLVEEMDAFGIQKAVVAGICFPGSRIYGKNPDTNEFVARTVMRHKERFIGFACVDPKKGETAANDLEYSVRQFGLKGLKLHPCAQEFYPDDPKIHPVIEKAVKLRIPIEIHSGHSDGPLKYGRAIHIDGLATTFPEAVIIMLHIGGSKGRFPNNSYEALEVAYKNDNVVLETSHASMGVIRKAIGLIGPERIVYGSDFGGGSHNTLFELMKITELQYIYPKLMNFEALKLILGGNMSRIINR